MKLGLLILIYLSSFIIATQKVPTADDVKWSFEQAQKFYASGAYDQAVDKYAQVIGIKSRLLDTSGIQYSIGEITAPVMDASLYQTGNSYFKMAKDQFEFSHQALNDQKRQDHENRAREYIEKSVYFFRETENQTQIYDLKVMSRNRIIQAWYELGDYGQTIQESQYLIEHYPESEYVINAMYEIGWSYYRMGEYEKSVEAFKQLVESFPSGYQRDRALFQIGESYYNREEYREAIPFYQSLVESARIDQLTDEEIARMRREKIAGLVDETMLELALKSQIKIGSCYAALGDYEKAAQTYRSVVGLFTKEGALAEEAYRRLADMYYQAGDFERSVQTFRTAIDEVSDPFFRARMQSLLAERYYNDGRYEEAIREYRLYIKAYSDVAIQAGFGPDEAGYKIGRSFYEMGQERDRVGMSEEAGMNYRKAIDQYNMILQDYPLSRLKTACLFNVALSYQVIDNEETREEALERFRAIVKNYPEGEYAQSSLFQIARIYYDRKDYGEAITVYKQIVEDYGNSARLDVAYFELAIAQRDGGMGEESVSNFIKVGKGSSLYFKAVQEASQLLISMKEYDRALEILNEGLVIAEDDNERSRYFYLQGKALLGKESYAEAILRFNEVLSLTNDPQIVESGLYSRGISYLNLGQYREAEQDLAQLVRSDDVKIRTSAQRMLGMARIRQRKEAEAIVNYRSLVAEETTDPAEKAEYLLLLAELYHGLNSNEEAEQVARQVIALPLEDLRVEQGTYYIKERAYYLLGDTYVRRRDPESLIDIYSKALELYPKGYYASDMEFTLGTSYFELGQLKQAADTFEGFISKYPNNANIPYAYYYMGYSYFNQTDFETSARIFTEMAKRFPRHEMTTDAIYRAGESYFNLGQFEKALEFYQEVLRDYPNSEQADDTLYNMGWASLELDRGDVAIGYFKQLIEQFPNSDFSPNAQFTIGDYYYNRQDYELALEAYENMANRYPDNPLAERIPELTKNLREIMAYLEYEKAMIPFREAMSSKDPGKFSETISLFEEILDKYPGTESEIGALINMGMCYESLSRWKDAIKVYDRVQEEYERGRTTPEAHTFAKVHRDWITANRL